MNFDQIGEQLVGYLRGKLLVPVESFQEPPGFFDEEFDMWYESLMIEDKDRAEDVPIGRFLELIDAMATTLNQAKNPLVFTHGGIVRGLGAQQKIHRCGNVALRLTAAYDSMGKYTQCSDHLDWEECDLTDCQFVPVKIHDRGVMVHIDCMVKKQDSLVEMV